jgi:predicted P-loop ATPase
LSDNTNDFNPLMDFFNSYIERTPTGVIDELWSCFNTTDNQHLAYFGKKWLVGLISSIHGTHSPLMLILCGEVQNTGKTEAFRRMLPDELRAYYAESKLDAGKDDEILMTQKILIVDDEMGGKSKAESKRLKDLTSKQTFSLREPYGRNNVDLNRLAVLGGTTNDLAVLNDPTGNRRLLPSEIISINHAKYNSIDKIDLIMEAYHLYKSGFVWQLSKHDIERLNSNTAQFEDHSLERELLQKYLLMPQHFPNHIAQEMTATDVKIYIELRSNQRMQLKKIGTELKSIGYESKHKKINGKTQQIYLVIAENIGEYSNISNNPYTIGENPPF